MTTGAHGEKNAPEANSGSAPDVVRELHPGGRTSVQRPRINQARRGGSNVAAGELDLYIAEHRGLQAEWAERLGLDHTTVRDFREPDGDRLTVGDVLVMPAEHALGFFGQLSARLRGNVEPTVPPDPLDRLERMATIDHGEFVHAIDGAIETGLDERHVEAIEKAGKKLKDDIDAALLKARASAGKS